MVSGRMPDLRRHWRMAELCAQGMTLGQVARKLGVTKRYVQDCLAKQQTPRTPGRCSACEKALASPVALPREADLLCLECLAKRPGTPFGQMLKAFRVSAGWTQRELSERANVGQTKICAFECGRLVPKWMSVAKLFAALDVIWVRAPSVRRQLPGNRTEGKRKRA
jgi:DNA-binding XRE family transcriptional regulator